MGNKRIQDLPSKGTTIAANDILEVSEYQSPGVYTSKKILGSELGGVTTFTALTDTPSSYTGQTLKFVRVNAGETALEFATVSVSDTNIANTQLTLPTGTRKLIWGGANSTDILSFRNSTDTKSILSIAGNGEVVIDPTDSPTNGLRINTTNTVPVVIGYSSNTTAQSLRIYNSNQYESGIGSYSHFTLQSEVGYVAIRGGNSVGALYRSIDLYGGTTNLGYRLDNSGMSIFTSNTSFYNGNGGISYQANDKIVVDGFNLAWKNTTSAPSTNITDHFRMYSDDVVAGNAAPHFRTEVGDIIKLYKQASAGITTVADLVTVLTNLGLLG